MYLNFRSYGVEFCVMVYVNGFKLAIGGGNVVLRWRCCGFKYGRGNVVLRWPWLWLWRCGVHLV